MCFLDGVFFRNPIPVSNTFFYFLESDMTPEGKFKYELRKEIERRFPGAMVLHLDPNEIQGIPDLLILYKDRWAALEGKAYKKARRQTNQDYYVSLMDKMSFARIVYPENAEEVLYELQQALES